MNNFGLYLLEVSICLTVFYLVYILLFSRNTFFRMNRLYLLAALLFAFVIPATNFPMPETSLDLNMSRVVKNSMYVPLQELPGEATSKISILNYGEVWLAIYLAGALLLLAKMILSLLDILRLKKISTRHRSGQFIVIRTNGSLAFSFFNMIFLPAKETDPLILEHEKVHVRSFHWIDVVLMEVACIVLWVNPVIFLYRRSLKINHEYFADASAIQRASVGLKEYLGCMLAHAQVQNPIGPISYFYSHSIKKRILMLTNARTSNRFSLTYLVVLPVICILLSAYSIPPGDAVKVIAPTAAGVATTHGSSIEKPSASPVDVKKIKRVFGFGMRENALLQMQHHSGIDLVLNEGETVMATADGVVVASVNDPKRGNYVLIRHNAIYSTQYSHMRNVVIMVGDKVKQGQTIGYVGSTGLALQPHLHYEVLKYGHMVDPAEYLPGLDRC
jgi:murein DD-endopeptidase MepM/ murein hydrolase activator NlpD